MLQDFGVVKLASKFTKHLQMFRTLEVPLRRTFLLSGMEARRVFFVAAAVSQREIRSPK